MENKKYFVIGGAVAVVIGVVFLSVWYAKNKKVEAPVMEEKSASTFESFAKMESLTPADEIVMQSKLSEIVSKGKQEECGTLSDPRYQYACNDLFKNMKK